MVETISPVVYGTRARWAGALSLHAAGAGATAAAFGAAVAAAGGMLGAPWGRAGALVVAAVAVAYLGRELLGLRVPVPQLRRQVPDWWRTYFGRPVAALLYGGGLGVGFLTYLSHGTLVAVAAGVAATGDPLVGASVMLPFGLARGLAPLVSARAAHPEDGRRLVDRLSGTSGRLRSAVNAAALALVAAAAAAGAVDERGGWSAAAAAALALVFAWAAISKLARHRRWLEALRAHRLPATLERPARWLVPGTEALVPALVLSGRERAAAALAGAAILAFSLALIRSAVREGRRVPCGCFGRASIDVRAALARNAMLAAAAAGTWVGASPDPGLRLPHGADVLPAISVAAALVAGGVTAWRAGVWLGRGRA